MDDGGEAAAGHLERLLGRVVASGASTDDVEKLRIALGLEPTVESSSPSSLLNEPMQSFLRTEYTSSSVSLSRMVASRSPSASTLSPLVNSRMHRRRFTSSASAGPSAAESIDNWFFDVFEYVQMYEPESGPLVEIGELLLARHHCIAKFGLSETTLRNFLVDLAVKYNDLPYHNQIHAADVAQSLGSMLRESGLGKRGDDLLKFAAITAALGHDVAHPGLTSRFLIETRHPIAVRYNDRSPLENMHASTFFQVMWSKPGRDIIGHLPRPQQQRYRRLVINLILATDNAEHERVLRGLQSNDDERVYEAALHAADLGGTGKTPALAFEWTERVLQEFYHQGDLERNAGMPVIPVNDRFARQPKGVFQEGFISAIVLPLYKALHAVPELDMSTQIAALEANLKFWVGGTSGDRPKLKSSRSFHVGPSFTGRRDAAFEAKRKHDSPDDRRQSEPLRPHWTQSHALNLSPRHAIDGSRPARAVSSLRARASDPPPPSPRRATSLGDQQYMDAVLEAAARSQRRQRLREERAADRPASPAPGSALPPFKR